MKRSISYLSAIVCSLLLAACNEEQILYKTKATEPIPPVPVQLGMPPAGQAISPHGAGGSIPIPAAPAKSGSFAKGASLAEAAEPITLAGHSIPVPTRYESRDPSSAMRIAEFRVPGAAGESDGEWTVFYFGKGQGGSAADNFARWQGQFKPLAAGKDPMVAMDEFESNGLRITTGELEGFYNPGAMAAGPPPPADAPWAMIALVVEGGPEGPLFLRWTGPSALIAREKAAIEGIAGGIRAEGAAVAAAAETPPPGVEERGQDAKATAGGDLKLSRVEAPGVAFAVPATWSESASPSAMRALQFAIPGPADNPGATGEFVVFYFGPGGGGTVDDNLRRWAGQITRADGSSTYDKADIERTTIGSFSLASIYAEGTYAPTAMGPMAPAPVARDGFALMGIIVEGGAEGPLYLRFTGPIETVKAQRDHIGVLLRSLEPMGKPQP